MAVASVVTECSSCGRILPNVNQSALEGASDIQCDECFYQGAISPQSSTSLADPLSTLPLEIARFVRARVEPAYP